MKRIYLMGIKRIFEGYKENIFKGYKDFNAEKKKKQILIKLCVLFGI